MSYVQTIILKDGQAVQVKAIENGTELNFLSKHVVMVIKQIPSIGLIERLAEKV